MQLALTALLFLFPNSTAAQEEPAEEATVIEQLSLTLTLPEMEEAVAYGTLSEQLPGRWTGKMGKSEILITVFAASARDFQMTIPEAVLMLVEDNAVHEDGSDFRFDETELIEGAYGGASYAMIGKGKLRSEEGEPHSSMFALAGIANGQIYSIEVEARPVASRAVEKELMHFFEKGVQYTGALDNYEWTDEEAEARWRRDVPPGIADDMKKVLRTKHYIFLTNASGGKLYAKKMEENYKAIQKLFPFEETKSRRLMPVFIFRTRDQYIEFFADIAGSSKEAAARSAGHAWRDYYATMYESPGDPTHLHEQVHQIFANRLLLGGGGSWFQEGLAEYTECRPNELSGAAREVKKGRHKRLPEFVQMASLIYSTSGNDVKGGSEAGDLYKQAALLIEFMRESKLTKKGFPKFVAEIGRVRGGDVEAINAVLMKLYEVDLVQLDELFIAYCKKR